MPAVAGNAWALAVGKQAAKGTAQTTPGAKLKYTGGFGPAPNRSIINLAETDASRQIGDPVVVGYRVQGSSEHYLRSVEFHKIADLLLGTTVSTGAGPYVHTASSPSSGTAGYATLYRALNSTALVEQMIDCQIVSMQIRGGTEQVLTYACEWLGLSFVEGATDPVLSVSNAAPLVYPHVTVTKAGSATAIVDSFELNINQNRSLILGDTGLAASQIVAGQYVVSGSLSLLFESDADYRTFHTGTAGGTTPTTTIASETLVLLAEANATTDSVTFDMDAISASTYEMTPNTDGAPLRATMEFSSRRGATLANVLEVITKNSVATV